VLALLWEKFVLNVGDCWLLLPSRISWLVGVVFDDRLFWLRSRDKREGLLAF